MKIYYRWWRHECHISVFKKLKISGVLEEDLQIKIVNIHGNVPNALKKLKRAHSIYRPCYMRIIRVARSLGDCWYSDKIWHLALKVGNPKSISWISIKVVQFANPFVESFGVIVKMMNL